MKDKFSVEVRDGDCGHVDLCVTHNGYQWINTWLEKDELPLVINEIQRYLDLERQGSK